MYSRMVTATSYTGDSAKVTVPDTAPARALVSVEAGVTVMALVTAVATDPAPVQVGAASPMSVKLV